MIMVSIGAMPVLRIARGPSICLSVAAYIVYGVIIQVLLLILLHSGVLGQYPQGCQYRFGPRCPGKNPPRVPMYSSAQSPIHNSVLTISSLRRPRCAIQIPYLMISCGNPYAGEPTAEGDEAWHTLHNNMSVRVTAEKLAAHDQTSVALPNGGYLAWLGVFHELHCVKMLQQWSWREHYFPK